MGPLFVAADRLSRDPGDREGTTELVAAMKAAEGSSAPYGMDKLWWDGVQVQAAELVALNDGHDPDPESIAARASPLRERTEERGGGNGWGRTCGSRWEPHQ